MENWSRFVSSGFGAPLPLSHDEWTAADSKDPGPGELGCWGADGPTAVDLWSIEVVYEFIAAVTPCSRCGEPLGRRLRVVTCRPRREPLRWRVSVTARCKGWRRHRHVATVIPSTDVTLGPLHGSRR